MNKVILIDTSPRKNGNSAAITQKLAAEITDAEVEVFVIREKTMKPCLACGACRKKDKPSCVLKDDMGDLISKIDECDAFVLAAPIYFHYLNGPAKTFIDRLYCFYNPTKPMASNASKRGKKAAIIGSCGTGPADIYAKRCAGIAENFSVTGVDETKTFVCGNVNVPGSCLENEAYATEISAIAEWLGAKG